MYPKTVFYRGWEAEEFIEMSDKIAIYFKEEDAAAEIQINQKTNCLQI